jgi:hypothetical protein
VKRGIAITWRGRDYLVRLADFLLEIILHGAISRLSGTDTGIRRGVSSIYAPAQMVKTDFVKPSSGF